MSEQELREKLLDYFSYGASGFHAANGAVQASALNIVDDIAPLITQYANEARRELGDELKKRLSPEFFGGHAEPGDAFIISDLVDKKIDVIRSRLEQESKS